jgi:hypothetical protein
MKIYIKNLTIIFQSDIKRSSGELVEPIEVQSPGIEIIRNESDKKPKKIKGFLKNTKNGRKK